MTLLFDLISTAQALITSGGNPLHYLNNIADSLLTLDTAVIGVVFTVIFLGARGDYKLFIKKAAAILFFIDIL